MIRERIERVWQGRTAIVAATGPSLTAEVAESCRMARVRHNAAVMAVSDAWRLMPWADALYASDAAWWNLHKGTDFAGEKWSAHHDNGNDKLDVARKYGLHLVAGKTDPGFSFDPACIHYGGNSGFQAVNLTILFGAARILMVGFDMRMVAVRTGQGITEKRHFFGDHAPPLRNQSSYENFIKAFDKAARKLRSRVEIVNCTSGSALRCFPMRDLTEALRREMAFCVSQS